MTTSASEPVETPAPAASIDVFAYDNAIVRRFMVATLVWAIVGMLAGLTIALKLVLPQFLGSAPSCRTAGCARCTRTR